MSKIKNSMFIVMLLSLMVLALAACSDSSNKDTAKKKNKQKTIHQKLLMNSNIRLQLNTLLVKLLLRKSLSV